MRRLGAKDEFLFTFLLKENNAPPITAHPVKVHSTVDSDVRQHRGLAHLVFPAVVLGYEDL
jgi:hypothetical protein